jgi:hypothetical protein
MHAIIYKDRLQFWRALVTPDDVGVHGNCSRARPYCFEHLKGGTHVTSFCQYSSITSRGPKHWRWGLLWTHSKGPPLRIEYLTGGRIHPTTFDLLVLLGDLVSPLKHRVSRTPRLYRYSHRISSGHPR